MKSEHYIVAVSFIPFVRMASRLGCIIKFEEILHTHIRLTKYDKVVEIICTIILVHDPPLSERSRMST